MILASQDTKSSKAGGTHSYKGHIQPSHHCINYLTMRGKDESTEGIVVDKQGGRGARSIGTGTGKFAAED